MIRALCWEEPAGPDSGRRCREVTLAEAAAAWRERGAQVWVDAAAPDRAEMVEVARQFELHDVIVRTAMQPNSRPKVADFGDFITVTLYVPRAPHVSRRGVPPFGIAGSGLAPLSEVDFVFSARYLVTAHPDPVPLIEGLLDGAMRDDAAMAKGMGGLVHRVLDETVDSYFPVLDRLVEQVEDVQEFAFVGDKGPPKHDAMRPLFRLKKGLFALRRVMSPQADALRVLARGGVSFYEQPDRTEFEDIFDRAVRVEQTILMNQELLINARESYLTRVSNELGIATQALLVVTCIILVPLFVTALYGMRFPGMPELGLPLGHGWAIVLIVGIDGLLLYYFHRQHWA
jgi:magnesium transporter